MTLSSAYIELFIRGEKSGGEKSGGEMSQYRERACVRERQRQSFALREGRPLTSTQAFASWLRPAGGEASGLQPSGIDSPMLLIFSSVSVSLPPSLLPSL